MKLEIQPGAQNTSFFCGNIKIANETFEVLQGDIIGACLLDDPQYDIHPLDIVASSDYHQLYSEENSDFCSNIGSVDTSSPRWSVQSGVALHLYLETVGEFISPIHSFLHWLCTYHNCSSAVYF